MIKLRFRLKTLLWLIFILVLMALAGGIAFRTSMTSSLIDLQATTSQRLDLYANSLNAEIEHFSHLPSILGLSPHIDNLLHSPANQKYQQLANIYLENLSERTGATAIYIQDVRGQVVATSNWHRPDSYLGENDGFRPYFTDVLNGHPGRFFGVGTTKSEAGYYLSEGLFDKGRLIGVAVVKVSLSRLEKTWRDSKTLVMVADQNDVVILSSEPGWKFTTLKPFSTALQDAFDRSRQYNRMRLQPLGLEEVRTLDDGMDIVRLPKGRKRTLLALNYPSNFLAQTLRLPASEWRLIVLLSLQPVYELAVNRAALASVLTALSLVGLLLLNERRRRLRDKLAAKEALQQAYNDLEIKVHERTADLSLANALLQNEVTERTRTEVTLRKAQDELVQAGKLAVIGQLSTGMAHELNQPLAALRTLSGNTVKFLERGQIDMAQTNLNTINHLVDRMGQITGALKSYARKSTSSIGTVDIYQAIENTLVLLMPRVHEAQIRVERPDEPERFWARCDANRFEQVLLNLLTNAVDAVQSQAERVVWLTCQQGAECIVLRVRDSGEGLPEDIRQQLFEPFFTTKPVGIGLGLGLTLSAGIIAEAGGSLTADNHAEGGAVFTLMLPIAAKDSGHV